MKKVGKTTRPFRYDLNQILYYYTIEVRNRFKGLASRQAGIPTNRMCEELWMEVHDLAEAAVIKSIPNKKICKKAKWLSEEALQIAEKRREIKGKEEKESHLNSEFYRLARRDKKAFLSNQCKEIEENNRMGKTGDLFKKIRDTRGIFHTKWAQLRTEMVWT